MSLGSFADMEEKVRSCETLRPPAVAALLNLVLPQVSDHNWVPYQQWLSLN